MYKVVNKIKVCEFQWYQDVKEDKKDIHFEWILLYSFHNLFYIF